MIPSRIRSPRGRSRRLALFPSCLLAAALPAHGYRLLAAVASAGGLIAQITYHVAPDGNDAWTGRTRAAQGPNGAKRTIQAAIDVTVGGELVLVAGGVYTGSGNRDLDLGGRSITVVSTTGPGGCVIDCQASAQDPHRAFWFHSGEGAASVIDGFAVRNGLMGFGGAMLCEAGSSPTVRNCVFDGNTAFPTTTGGEGGAVRCLASAPQFVNCRFLHNAALRIAGIGGRGGAIQFVGSTPTLSDCVFEENTAGGGGGIHSTSGTSASLVGCRFERNWTADRTFNGGGGYLGSLGGVHEFVACSFIENDTARVCGAIWVTQGTTANLTGCRFLRNHGFDAACVGAANGSRATIRDCLFAGNSADIFSSAVEVWNGPPTGAPSHATVTNCTFADNVATAGYGAMVVSHTSSVTASNCILWNNTPSEIVLLDTAAVSLTHSDVQGGWAGAGNVSVDPMFAGGNQPYALASGSPCIDGGDPGFISVPNQRDLLGAWRIWDGNDDQISRVDLGAFEFGSPRGDLDSDGFIGPADLVLLATNLHTTATSWMRGDLDGDGDADLDDLQILMAVFGMVYG